VSRLLVDTHALLWWLADDPALPPAARDAIADPGNEALVSTASLWEIAIKRALGKLAAPDDLPVAIIGGGFVWLPVGADHAWRVHELPVHHRDPFDRLLVAQAQIEKLAVVTGDPHFGPYEVQVRW
jgi:PIN domain nuclease of toxin-antitoxin system